MDDPAHFGAIGAALGNTTHMAIIYATASGHIGYWNAGAEALFGYSPAEVSGLRVDLIVPHEYREMHWAGFNRTIGSTWRGAESWGDIDGLHKSGEPVLVQVLLTPIFDADGRVDSVLAMFRRRT